MSARKVKTVFTADPVQIAAIDALVQRGRYRTTSEFLREAIDEKLRRLRASRLSDQVTRYVARGHADEDLELIRAQAPVEDD